MVASGNFAGSQGKGISVMRASILLCAHAKPHRAPNPSREAAEAPYFIFCPLTHVPTCTVPWCVFCIPFLTSSFNNEVWRWLHSYPGHEWTRLNLTMVRDALRVLFILLRVPVRDSACNGAAPCKTWMFMCTIPCTVVPTCHDIFWREVRWL